MVVYGTSLAFFATQKQKQIKYISTFRVLLVENVAYRTNYYNVEETTKRSLPICRRCGINQIWVADQNLAVGIGAIPRDLKTEVPCLISIDYRITRSIELPTSLISLVKSPLYLEVCN